MSNWSVQDAKARFSKMLDECVVDGPQIVTKRGAETAVLVSIDEWRKLKKASEPTLMDLLLADEPRFELELPDRREYSTRDVPDFD